MAKKVLTATALALLLGISAAAAQSGGEARSNDRKMEKALDTRELTPIRPIRRVGEDSWPDAKNQPAARETTGQSAKKEEPSKQEPTQDSKQEPVKQESTKQEPATQSTPKNDTAKQDAAKSEQKQDTAKDTAKPEQKQDTAKQDAPKLDAKPQDNAQNNAANRNDDKGFASIRLGTDKNGHVAINESQERQISSALRKQRIQTVDVAVTVGAVTPASVRLGAVSGDIVAVLPQFRGYSYFATRENIVIVEPGTKKIVALVPVQNTATASRSREITTERSGTASRAPHSTTTVTKRETTGSALTAEIPSEEEILGSPVVTTPRQTTVTRTYRAAPRETVIIEHYRRPRIFGLW